MSSSLQFLDLPNEIIHRVLSLLSPLEIVTCNLVNKFLNSIISESSALQYYIALVLAKADDNPCSVASLRQKLSDLRSSEYAWSNLQPKFIASLSVMHRTSGIYDLSGGTYLLGNIDRMALQYVQLPSRVDDPVVWKKIALKKTIIDMGFGVFEHDLIAIFTSTTNTENADCLDIEMSLLEYSTGKPHPMAKNSTIFIMTSSFRPSLMCEIVGDNLVLILNFDRAFHGEDRIFIWDWRTGVLKVAFLAPIFTYSGIIFLDEDHILLPNAKSAAFDIFLIPTKPIADLLTPILSLQLPSVASGVEISYITCRAEPNPIPDISRLNKKRRAKERADAGMDEMDPFAPKRGFLASAEDAICIFHIRFRTVPGALQGGFHIQFQTTLFIHRGSFLKIARRELGEGASDLPQVPLSDHQAGPGVGSGPQIAWANWGPPVSRWFDANLPNRWITTTAGQRCASICESVDYSSPITVFDFNPFTVQKMKAKLRESEIAKERVVTPRYQIEMAYSAPSQDVVEDDDDELDEMPFLSVIEEDAQTTDDGGGDSDVSMPGLDLVSDSDGESPSVVYTTSTEVRRHPRFANRRLITSPSSVGISGLFAEKAEGRLPYVSYVSKTEYEYDGVLLDEERILGITTDEIDGISAIDVFYFG